MRHLIVSRDLHVHLGPRFKGIRKMVRNGGPVIGKSSEVVVDRNAIGRPVNLLETQFVTIHSDRIKNVLYSVNSDAASATVLEFVSRRPKEGIVAPRRIARDGTNNQCPLI